MPPYHAANNRICYDGLLSTSGPLEATREQSLLPTTQASGVIVLPCVLSAIACTFALCFVLRVDRLDLHVPLIYWGDALYFNSWVKGLVQGNSMWFNASLGMPFGADWRDFPVNLSIEAAFGRIFSAFTSSSGLVLNLLWLLGTAAASGFAAYCLQRLGIQRWVAGSLGIVYALQPFTFYRGVSHFNLMFYLVPLLATGAIEITTGRVPRNQSRRSNGASLSTVARLIAPFRAIPTYIYLACLAQGFTYVYNSFFSVVLFAVAGLLAFTAHRRKGALFASSLAVGIICSAVLTNLAPSLIYRAEHGANAAMAYKSPVMAEVYGLKLRHLLAPIPENPLPPIQYVQKKLDGAGFTDDQENATSRLGTIGSVGFVLLLASALASCLRKPFGDDRRADVLGACSALALACVLLATVGGFGAIFNVFAAPDIRCYNRIVVFIDFFAITAVGLQLTRAYAWCQRRNWPTPISVGALGLLIVFGVSDQAVTASYRDNIPRENQFKLDDVFVKLVESALPRNASVFQLPFTEFPAEAPPFQMGFYDHSRAYLHSDTLRWSWGGISGRKEGEWVRETSHLPVNDMLRRLSGAGFSGIWIDRFGYAPGTSPEREIGEALGSQPLQRSDGHIAFYDLRAYSKQLRASETPRDVHLTEQYALHPVEVNFQAGFYDQERNDKQTWRWCSRHGVMQLHNTLPQSRIVKLVVRLQTGSTEPETITVSAEGKSERVVVTIHEAPYVRDVKLPAGQQVNVSFDCECKRFNAPGDSRNLYFAIINPRIVE